MFFRTSLVISALFLITACETPRAPLSQSKARFPSIDVAVVGGQEEVYISSGNSTATGPTYYYVPPGTSVGTAAAGGLLAGFIVAGINSAEAADARKDVIPVNRALDGWDYNSELYEAIEEKLPALSWTEVSEVKILQDRSRKAIDAFVIESKNRGALVVGATYFLSRNAGAVVISAQAYLHPTPQPPPGAKPVRKAPPAVFVTSVSYEMPSPVNANRRSENIPAWIANDAEALRVALSMGAEKVAELLLMQLEDGNKPIVKSRGQRLPERVTNAPGQPIKVKVQLVESGPDGDLVRTQDGKLHFLGKPVFALDDGQADESENVVEPSPPPADNSEAEENLPAENADEMAL